MFPTLLHLKEKDFERGRVKGISAPLPVRLPEVQHPCNRKTSLKLSKKKEKKYMGISKFVIALVIEFVVEI